MVGRPVFPRRKVVGDVDLVLPVDQEVEVLGHARPIALAVRCRDDADALVQPMGTNFTLQHQLRGALLGVAVSLTELVEEHNAALVGVDVAAVGKLLGGLVIIHGGTVNTLARPAWCRQGG